MVDVRPLKATFFQSSFKRFIKSIPLFNDYLSVFCFIKIFDLTTFIAHPQNISDWSKRVQYWPYCTLDLNIV